MGTGEISTLGGISSMPTSRPVDFSVLCPTYLEVGARGAAAPHQAGLCCNARAIQEKTACSPGGTELPAASSRLTAQLHWLVWSCSSSVTFLSTLCLAVDWLTHTTFSHLA